LQTIPNDSLFADTWASDAGAFSWDVSGDGKRFLMRRNVGGARLIVEKNWLAEIIGKPGTR